MLNFSTLLRTSGSQPLSVTTGGNTTFYLYGLGPIGELTSAWSYSLPDGTGTSRQVTDASGTVTFAATYTPWGDTFESFGEGSFTWGYFGGLMDAATGLLYVGNGQYYDPSTGRFLTRGANPNSTNPYVPWNGDPSGAFLAPLALLALVFSNKRKRGKWDMFLIVLVLGLSLGLGLAACGGDGGSNPPPQATSAPPQPTPAQPPASGGTGGAGTDTGSTSSGTQPPATPVIVPISCPVPEVTATSIPTPTSTPHPSFSGTVGVFGGSGGDLTYNGPSIPGSQMTAWTSAPASFTLWYSQYPGYHDYRFADHPERQDFWNDPKTNSGPINGYSGKPGQAHWAFEYANPATGSPTILVGYSAGADAAVLHAELRWKNNLPIDALVLLDPAFDSYDLDGAYLNNAGYKQKLAILGVRVLIVDTTQSQWAGWSSTRITYCPIGGKNHGDIDDDPVVRENAYAWVSTGQMKCSGQ